MANKKIKIGIIGCGTIGTQLAEAIEKKFSDRAELFALCDKIMGKAQALRAISSSNPEILSVDELTKACDLIVEAASGKTSYEIAKGALENGKDVMIMSIGGILGKHERLFSLAQTKNCHIHLPSGALCGLDAVKSASMAKIDKAIKPKRRKRR